MKYDFLDKTGYSKFLASFIEGLIWLILLFYVGFNQTAKFATMLLTVYMWISLGMYVIQLIAVLLCTKNTFKRACEKRSKETTCTYIAAGIVFGGFLVWLVFAVNGFVVYNNKLLVLILLCKLILPALSLIVTEIKARVFGYVNADEAYLLNNDYSSYELVKEYRSIRDSLLLDTNTKENPKVFKKLSSQYCEKINGYF